MPGELDRTVARLQQEADSALRAKEAAERGGGAQRDLREREANLRRLRDVCREFSSRATAERVRTARVYTGGVIPSKVWVLEHETPGGANVAFRPGLYVTADGRPLIGVQEVAIEHADTALVERFIDGMAKRLIVRGS
jgi:hypothetical protein